MKKRICLFISALILVLSLAGCGSSQNKAEYDQDTMEQVADIMISSMSQMDATSFESFREASDFALDTMLYESGLSIASDDFIAILSAWETGISECGNYVSHDDWEVQVSGSDVKLKTQAKFVDMDASLEFVFDQNGNLENLTIGAKYTTGQILQKAGLNTLIGMGTVFAVLIFISFLISLMKYIPALQARLSGNSSNSAADTPEPKPVPKPNLAATASEAPAAAEKDDLELAAVISAALEQKDDLELAAVISAAIAQAEGVSPDGFIVRSIKRRTTNKWNGGR